VKEALYALAGAGAVILMGSYIDPMNVTDCKEYAKKQTGVSFLADHETELSKPEYQSAYLDCIRNY